LLGENATRLFMRNYGRRLEVNEVKCAAMGGAHCKHAIPR